MYVPVNSKTLRLGESNSDGTLMDSTPNNNNNVRSCLGPPKDTETAEDEENIAIATGPLHRLIILYPKPRRTMLGNLNTFWTLILLAIFFVNFTSGSTVYVSNGTNILKIKSGHSGKEIIFSQPEGRIVGLAADIQDGYLFWSDVSKNKRGIYRSRLNGKHVRLILGDVEECNGLTVNWVTNHLYWTDAKTSRLEMSNYDGAGRRILFGSQMDQPRGIAVDPVSGYIFWADQGTKTIERSKLDGSNRQVLINSSLYWPNQMAISHATTRRLYWVDAMTHSIMSSDMDGKNMKLERNTTKKTNGNPIFGLAVSGNRAIISTWFQASLFSTLVQAAAASWKVESSNLGEKKLFSIIVVEDSIQNAVFLHPCGKKDKAGCSHLCMPLQGLKYQCACPTFGGLAMSKDGKTCLPPDELLLYTLTGTGQVGFHAIDWPVSSYLTLVGWTTNPSAVAYDPVEKVVYWSDVSEYAIYTTWLDGTNRNVLLNATHGIGIVDGLAIDWIQRRLYFTNLGLTFHSVDGSACASHTVEMIALDGRMRRTIVSDIEKPRGLDLDPYNGYLYFTDWGSEPKVVRTLLDGTEAEILKDEGLSSPNGLTVNNGQLYLTDSNYNNKTSGAQILVFSTATNEWKQINLMENIKIPMGIAVRDDILYYTDWFVENDGYGFILLYNLQKPKSEPLAILVGERPTGLHYSTRELASTVPDATCDNAACTDECVRTPMVESSEPFHCLCPDIGNWILSSDKATCTEPQNFLIVADLNAIKMKGLDNNLDSKIHTLHYGHADSNFVAVVYSHEDKTLFWSDLHDGRQAILHSDIESVNAQVLMNVNYSVDCLALDEKHQKIYWTGYSNETGLIAEVTLKHGASSYKELLLNLDSPRAITIHPDKKFIFWTEYGLKSGKPAIYRSHLTGRHHKTLMTKKLHWPNSLVIHQDELYVADGFYGRIYTMDFKGENQRELLYLSSTMDHIFGLQIHEHLLFYSRWYLPSVHMVDMITGKDEIFIDHLTRPTAIFVHHPANLSENSLCNTEKNTCSGICVPVPHDYHCTCEPGYQLEDDVCVEMTNPWQLTDDALCPDGCHTHAYCARHMPLLYYECVCVAGFEGNGKFCKVCPKDTYKPEHGNDTCIPCPEGSGTQNALAAKGCVCKSLTAEMIDGVCKETITTTTTEPTTTSTSTTTIATTTTTIKPTTAERIVSTRNQKANIGLPYFTDCPEGTTIRLSLPPQANAVHLPITWTAIDHLGNRILLESNVPFNKDGLTFNWTDQSATQKVIFTAIDRWNQEIACKFNVIVEDKEAPQFTYCPHNIVIKTDQYTERVLWPQPIAEDNTEIREVISSHKVGTDFAAGTTMVNYTAFDKAGNNATCNFTVTIIQVTKCDLPPIDNGAFVCGTDAPKLQMCYIACENNYGVNPLGIFGQQFKCNLKESIQKLVDTMKTQEPCQRNHHPYKVQQEFEIQFQGPCEQNNPLLYSKLSAAVTQYLDARNHCWDVTCEFSNLTILCGPSTDNHRYRRSDYFTVMWNVTISNDDRLAKSFINDILTAIEQELSKVAELLFINVKEQQYNSVPGSVKVSPPNWMCKTGEMIQKDYCIPCPPGSMLNVTSQKCTFCRVGFYQEEAGQTICKMCPDGVSAEEGAIGLSYCISIPAIDEMSKFLIITTCTFGFVFLCLVIFMYLQCQRQQRKASNVKTAPNPRTTTTSVYVAPPPFPRVKPVNDGFGTRDYMYVHEYEDIENASQVSKMPNPNMDALYRIPPHMQRRLASTENIYDD